MLNIYRFYKIYVKFEQIEVFEDNFSSRRDKMQRTKKFRRRACQIWN